MNRRKLGFSYEKIACQYLEEQGLKILEMNYHIRQGEVDIIAREGNILVFLEVKYRRDERYGHPAEAVTPAKQKKICLVAKHYCYTRHFDGAVRFDLVSLCGEEIIWYRDAFPYTGDD